MLPAQRDAVILALLQQHRVITIEEICTHCNCSAVTARRDLDRLEQQGLLRRTHGGATDSPGARQSFSAPDTRSALEARAALADRSNALIVTPTDTLLIRQIVERARRAQVPVIAESVVYQGASTTIAIDDYRAGLELGRYAGRYATEHLRLPIKVLDISHSLPNTESRSRGFAQGLKEAAPDAQLVVRVDGQGLRRVVRDVVAAVLAVHDDINLIMGINDDSALGALDAYRSAGLDEKRAAFFAFGLEGQTSRDLLMQGGPLKAAVAMFPEAVGRACVDAAVCAYHNCGLPERVIMPFAVVTSETMERFYQEDMRAGAWAMKWNAVAQLPTAGPGYGLLDQCHGRGKPARLGWVQVFSSHDWYRNVRQEMSARCRELGIALEVLDASDDLAQEVDLLKQAIGTAAARLVVDGDTIILDTGATAVYLARALHGRRAITVISNSLRVLEELADETGITVVSTGGVLRPSARSLTGAGAESTFRDLRADKAFLSGTGFSLNFGLSTMSISEAAVKQAMLRASREVFLLADHTKIGIESLVKVAPVESIHRLITDPGISLHDRLAFTQRGIEVTIAGETGKEVNGK
jgi:DeoR/GlpR family transcriptional regulator of sugar metabolism